MQGRGRRWGLLLLGLFWAWCARAATPRFEALGDAAVLRDNLVTSLARDRQGLIWLGTANGLVRYDGHEFRRFGVPSAQIETGSEQFVRALLPDEQGGLWVGMAATGLARWEPETGQWTRWQRSSAGMNDQVPASDTVTALAFAPGGGLWLGTQAGLDRLDLASGRIRHVLGTGGALPDARVQALLADARGRLWIGTGQGLFRLDADRLEPVALGEGAPGIALLAQDAQGRLLVGSGRGGLWRLAADGGAVEAIAAEARADALGSYYSCVQPNADEIWFGAAAGMERRRASDLGLIERLTAEGGSNVSAPRSDVRALLRDPSGIVWAGTYAQGLLRHLPPRPGISVVRADPAQWFERGDWDVRSVMARRNGEIWLGTQSQGIEILDAGFAPLRAMRPGRHGGAPGLPPGRVAALAETVDGSLWAAVDTHLVRFDAQGRWRETMGPARALIRRLQPAHDGGLWVATANGLARWQPGRHELEPVPLGEGVRELNGFAVAEDGALWVGGLGGLFRRAPGSDTVFERLGVEGLNGHTVVGLVAARGGGLWVDTAAGLHRLLGLQGREARFERVLGPESADAEGAFGANLLLDRRGRVWTHRGVFDPSTREHRVLGVSDGVDFGTGWFRAFAGLPDGRMLFGGSQGLLVIDPERFRPWDYAPPVVLTGLRVGGREPPPPGPGASLVLQPGETGFAAAIASLDYSQPAATRLRYRLRGLDEQWVSLPAAAHWASFTHLSPGAYRLEVQGSNREGVWSAQQLGLDVTLRPLWWQTLWARGAALAALLLAGWRLLRGWMRLRTRRLWLRQRELEARVAERTQALEAATQALAEQSRQLEAISLTDPLTGMHNRRFLEQQLQSEVPLIVRKHENAPPGSAAPAQEDLVFFVLDVDHFKSINDSHGHAAGDRVLIEMRQRLDHVLRASDYRVRWGGEEFLFVARGLPRADAAELAERACLEVEARPFDVGEGREVRLTCSIGFAAFPLVPRWPRALDWRQLVDLADAALYQAKRSGRNRWVGLLRAEAVAEAQLREDAQRGLDDWSASGRLWLQRRG